MEGGAVSPMADIITALTTGFTSVATNATSVITAIVPIALGIFAMVWIVRKATKWFKGMTN
jgi:hypothetical protein